MNAASDKLRNIDFLVNKGERKPDDNKQVTQHQNVIYMNVFFIVKKLRVIKTNIIFFMDIHICFV